MGEWDEWIVGCAKLITGLGRFATYKGAYR